jgi:hypothetical protein
MQSQNHNFPIFNSPSATLPYLRALPRRTTAQGPYRASQELGKETARVGIRLMRRQKWACGNPSCAPAAGASSSARTATPARQVRSHNTLHPHPHPLLALAPAVLGESFGLQGTNCYVVPRVGDTAASMSHCFNCSCFDFSHKDSSLECFARGMGNRHCELDRSSFARGSVRTIVWV